MLTVEYRITDGTRPENTHIRAVRGQAEALALCAHCMVRGDTVLCIKRDGALVMNADQISYALAHIGNGNIGH